LFKLPLLQWITFNGLIALIRATGFWKYPIRARGDLERMRFIDKLYWLYKAAYPMRRAQKKSGLEEHFERQKSHCWSLPETFRSERELSLSAVGDLINHRFLKDSKDSLYEQVHELIFNADVTMANLECPVFESARGDFVFDFKKPPPLYYDHESFGVVSGYKSSKYSFMAAACNHSLDFGIEGLESTIQTLRREGVAYSGINACEEDAARATMIEKNGFKIALVAYTFGLNAYKAPPSRPHAVNVMLLNDGPRANDFEIVKKQIAFCRNERADFVIFHLHWGMEHEFYPTPEQVELAHELAEMGVDAIIGHHPHVVQPVEYYTTRRDPSRVVPIFYSLGNLVNYFTAPYLRRSAVARIALAQGHGPDGSQRTYVKEARQVEVVQEIDEGQGRVYLRQASTKSA
jgi:poly-gamma-glutamate synthesis protein (capsule biosynthesis protein)